MQRHDTKCVMALHIAYHEIFDIINFEHCLGERIA